MPSNLRTGDGHHDERGVALAELAIVVPIMLLLLLVIFDFGQGFLAYISVTNGARDGARAAIDDSNGCASANPDTTPQTPLQVIAKNSSSPYDVDVWVVPDTPSTGHCSVRVGYTYAPILPFVTSSFSLPIVGTVGPLWDGTMSETMVSG